MLESEDIDGDLEEVNSASGDNTGDEEVAAAGKSEEEKQKPKKKSIIVWQCLNPECTVTSKRVLRYLYLLLQSHNLCQPICLISIFQYCNTFCSLLLWVGRQGWKKKKGRCLK